MKIYVLILGFAASLSGCISYPWRTTVASTGIIVDESGAPVKGAIVCAALYTGLPRSRLYAYDIKRTAADGSFTAKATGLLERTWFPLFAPLSPHLSAGPSCAACSPGYTIERFPCKANTKVTLRPMVAQSFPANAQIRRRPHGEFDVMANLLSECELNIPSN